MAPSKEVDYTSIEQRIVAWCLDGTWCLDGKDLHQERANELGVDRARTKIINFADLYGITIKEPK